NQSARAKTRLFGGFEVVVGYAVQRHCADLSLRYAEPFLGVVKRIVRELVEIRRLENLDIKIPLREIAFTDRAVEIVSHQVPVRTNGCGDFTGTQILLALIADPVELDVVHLALRIHELKGMNSKSVHVPVRIGHALVAIKMREHVGRFGRMRKEIKG